MDSYAVTQAFLESALRQETLPDFNEDHFEEVEYDWHSEAKYYEQQFMVLKDEYSELAKALGADCDPFFGDPYGNHEDILSLAKSLADKAWRYDELCD